MHKRICMWGSIQVLDPKEVLRDPRASRIAGFPWSGETFKQSISFRTLDEVILKLSGSVSFVSFLTCPRVTIRMYRLLPVKTFPFWNGCKYMCPYPETTRVMEESIWSATRLARRHKAVYGCSAEAIVKIVKTGGNTQERRPTLRI